MVIQTLMYKYRIYPTRKQVVRMNATLKICTTIYNDILRLCIDHNTKTGNLLGSYKCNKLIRGKYSVPSQVAQDISSRVNKAFSNYYKRCRDRHCKSKGYIRYKSKSKSFTYPQSIRNSNFQILTKTRLQLTKIGSVPIVLHRFPKGKIKTLTIKENKVGQWFATFCCERDINVKPNPSPHQTGIDMGVESFAVLSDGTRISNQEFYFNGNIAIQKLKKRLRKKTKSSKNYAKAKLKVTKAYLHIANKRKNFSHDISRGVVRRFSFISMEELDIKNMCSTKYKTELIKDMAWGYFYNNMKYKAVICGSYFIGINPARTSMTCSDCGYCLKKKLPLSEREFKCPKCGLVLDRDHNAAINIKKVGLGKAELNACGNASSIPKFNRVSCIDESGTISNQPE
jgi:putative transposase